MSSSTITLKSITRPIVKDLVQFRDELEQALHSDVRLINTITGYILKHRGKQFRPILTLLSARVCGNPSLNSYRAAAMIEMLHVATLIHDDVVDDASLRRGWPSLNRVWKNKLSVLIGDFILSKALINIIKLKDFEALEVISKTAEYLSAGEILQIEKSIRKTMTEDVYFDMIFQKTASLIATCCELGAITASGKQEDREALRNYGMNLGMAFQIKDDLFDLQGSEILTGKDIGSDVKKNMLTLPVIHALDHLPGPDKKRLRWILKQKSKSRKLHMELEGLVEKGGGIAYSEGKIDDYSARALGSISSFQDSAYRESLVNLIEFNVQRKK